MLKKLSIILISVFLLTFNANAGSDGELKLEKQPKKVEVAEKPTKDKKQKKSLQEIYPQPEDDDGFDEEHSDGAKK